MILQTQNAHLQCFAGVVNDYIISCVCSTLLFYGAFSAAVNKEKKYISSHLDFLYFFFFLLAFFVKKEKRIVK